MPPVLGVPPAPVPAVPLMVPALPLEVNPLVPPLPLVGLLGLPVPAETPGVAPELGGAPEPGIHGAFGLEFVSFSFP